MSLYTLVTIPEDPDDGSSFIEVHDHASLLGRIPDPVTHMEHADEYGYSEVDDLRDDAKRLLFRGQFDSEDPDVVRWTAQENAGDRRGISKRDDLVVALGLRVAAKEYRNVSRPHPGDPDFLLRHRENFEYLAQQWTGVADELDPEGAGLGRAPGDEPNLGGPE